MQVGPAPATSDTGQHTPVPGAQRAADAADELIQLSRSAADRAEARRRWAKERGAERGSTESRYLGERWMCDDVQKYIESF